MAQDTAQLRLVEPEQDNLERLRDAIAGGTSRVRFIRYSEALFGVGSSNVWIRPPSRMRRKWAAHFYMGDRNRFETIDEVVEWLLKQAGSRRFT